MKVKLYILIFSMILLNGCMYTVNKILYAGFRGPYFPPSFEISSSLYDLDENDNVYFTMTNGDTYSICKLNPETENIYQLTAGHIDYSPIYVKEKDKIYFLRAHEGKVPANIYEMNTDGTGLKKIYENNRIDIFGICYNSSDNKIYYKGESIFADDNIRYLTRTELSSDLYSYDLNDETEQRLTFLKLDHIFAMILSRDKQNLYLRMYGDSLFYKKHPEWHKISNYDYYKYNIKTRNIEPITFTVSDEIKKSKYKHIDPQAYMPRMLRKEDDFVIASDYIREYKLNFEKQDITLFTDKINGKSIISKSNSPFGYSKMANPDKFFCGMESWGN